MDEPQAIAHLKQANLAGLEYIVQHYQVKAIHTAYLITGDLAAAEDVVQAVFLHLLQTIYQFDDQRLFAPWFFRIVVNASVKEAKRQNRSVSLGEETETVQNWLLDTNPRPEEWLDTEDLRREVWNAIQQLPPEQRAVIVQRHFLDMSEAEMAAQLQRPPSTIKWWLHIARERLKFFLSAYQNQAVGEDHEKQ
jgi:RNA polymerase sigma-70 factor, ECF subfamily